MTSPAEQDAATRLIRVVIVDDHPVVRAGIIGMLGAEPDIEVVGEASTGREALRVVAAVFPDVVLMDLRMPDLDGVEATRVLREGTDPPRVVILTTYDTDADILRAVEAVPPVICSKTRLGRNWPRQSALPRVGRRCSHRRWQPSWFRGCVAPMQAH